MAAIYALACLAIAEVPVSGSQTQIPPPAPPPIAEPPQLVDLVPGAYFGPGYESKFLITTAPVTAPEGDAIAAKIGCQLAEIDSVLKNAYVSNVGMLQEGGFEMQNPWIALRRYRPTPATTVWSLPFPPPVPGAWIEPDYRTASYTNFAPGEPNNIGGNETRVAINEHAPGLWNDLPETAMRSALIELTVSPAFHLGGYQYVDVDPRAGYAYVMGQAQSHETVEIDVLDGDLDIVSRASCKTNSTGQWMTEMSLDAAKFVLASVSGLPDSSTGPLGTRDERRDIMEVYPPLNSSSADGGAITRNSPGFPASR